MSYEIAFLEAALKEWRALDSSLRDQFKKKLAERLEQPRVPKDRLHGAQRDRYKIKLRYAGYRLVYEVREAEILILVIAVGRRDSAEVYDRASRR